MPLTGPRPLPDPTSVQGNKQLPRRPDDQVPGYNNDHDQETLQESLVTSKFGVITIQTDTDLRLTIFPSPDPRYRTAPKSFPDLTTGYLDPYLHTPAPPPSSYSGPGPRRQASVGSRSLAPSDSASNFQRDDQEEEQEQQERGFDGPIRGLRVVGEDDEGQGDLGKGRGDDYGDPFTILRGSGRYSDRPSESDRPRQEQRYSTGLSYIDEEGDYYRTERDRPGSDYESLSTGTMRGGGMAKKDKNGEEGESLVHSAAVPAGLLFEHGEYQQGERVRVLASLTSLMCILTCWNPCAIRIRKKEPTLPTHLEL